MTIFKNGNKLTVVGKKVDLNYIRRLENKGYIVTVIIK